MMISDNEKVKECSYVAWYPLQSVEPLERFSLIPRQTCSFRHQLDFSGKLQPHCNYYEDYINSHIMYTSGTRSYSWVNCSIVERTKMPNSSKLRNWSRGPEVESLSYPKTMVGPSLSKKILLRDASNMTKHWITTQDLCKRVWHFRRHGRATRE